MGEHELILTTDEQPDYRMSATQKQRNKAGLAQARAELRKAIARTPILGRGLPRAQLKPVPPPPPPTSTS